LIKTKRRQAAALQITFLLTSKQNRHIVPGVTEKALAVLRAWPNFSTSLTSLLTKILLLSQ